MVIYQGGNIALHLRAVLAQRKLHDIFNVALYQHHPVRLAETPGRRLLSFSDLLHLPLAETGLVQVPLQGRPRQLTRIYNVLCLQNEDDLVDGTGRHFTFQQNRFIQRLLESRERPFDFCFCPARRFQALKPGLPESVLIPAQRAL